MKVISNTHQVRLVTPVATDSPSSVTQAHSSTLSKIYSVSNSNIYKMSCPFNREDLPISNRGGHCEIAALATIDSRQARIYGVPKMPLLAQKQDVISVRNIAKRHNSAQGEVMQINDFKGIAEEMGYEVTILRPENQDMFINIIKSHTIADKPIVVLYSFDSNNKHGINLNSYSKPFMRMPSVISEFNEKKETVTLNHYGRVREKIPVKDLFTSMNNLPDTNSKIKFIAYKKDEELEGAELEYVKKVRKHLTDNDVCTLTCKYTEYRNSFYNISKIERVVESVTPIPGSGFKNVVVSIEPDKKHSRWLNR